MQYDRQAKYYQSFTQITPKQEGTPMGGKGRREACKTEGAMKQLGRGARATA